MTEKAERDKKELDENKELKEVIEKKVSSVENGSVTVIVQDHKPIQINVYHKIL